MLATIKHSDNSALVNVAKYLTGYSERGEASSTFDATFVSFVCSWQGKHNLTADGVIGPKTWAKIAETAPTCSTSKNKKSAATCAVQLLIGELTVDGIYGSGTKKAMRIYMERVAADMAVFVVNRAEEQRAHFDALAKEDASAAVIIDRKSVV